MFNGLKKLKQECYFDPHNLCQTSLHVNMELRWKDSRISLRLSYNVRDFFALIHDSVFKE